MPNGIRLDLQRALAEGPGAIPNLEPLFAPGAIPPVFDEAPEVGLNDVGIDLETGQGTFSGVPMDTPIGQPVPPVKPSRGERLRRLLGNFLQNFGEGLTAAARAPSGSGFAAGFGAALSAPEERRLQQVRIDLLRANQAMRQQIAEQNAAFRQADLEAEETERQAGRIERENVRAGVGRRRFQDILTAGTRRAADFVAGRRTRAQEFEEKKELIRLEDKLAREREGSKPPTFSERRAAQRQRVNTMGAAFLVQSGGDVRAAIKLARESVKIDPQGFTAKNFAEIMRAIRSGNTSSAIEILRDALREQPPR